MLIARTAVLYSLLPHMLAGQTGARVPKGWQEFTSRAGYIAYFPGDWHLLDPNLPTLYIANFLPSQSVKAVVVPINRASISIAPAPAGMKSIEQWISRQAAAHRVQSRRSFSLERPKPDPPISVWEVVYESLDGPDATSWYFNLSGHMLVANLSYWHGDPNQTKYRELLRMMLRAIVPRAE